MVSIEFIYFFLPVYMGIYLLLSPKIRGRFAAAAGAAVVALINPFGLIVLAACVLSGYLGGILIHNFRKSRAMQRFFLITVIAVNAAAFLLFHSSNYENKNLITLLFGEQFSAALSVFGVSVYTFHAISYCADVYSGKCRCEHSFKSAAEYMAFFPVLAAGPLLEFNDMRSSLKRTTVSSELGAWGIQTLLVGLAQKLILSNSLYEMWSNIRDSDVNAITAATAWIGIAAFAMFVFFELSAFSNIARGLGALMGFTLPKNFDKPFTAISFGDFSKRFNVTLSRWADCYIYSPIASKSQSKIIQLAAILISAIITGLWYGIGVRTVIFAVIISLLIAAENLLQKHISKLPAAVRRIFFLFMLLSILAFFAFKNPADAISYILAMFGTNSLSADLSAEYFLKSYFWVFAVSLIISSGVTEKIIKKISSLSEYILTIIQPVVTIALLLLCTAFLISSDPQLLGCLI